MAEDSGFKSLKTTNFRQKGRENLLFASQTRRKRPKKIRQTTMPAGFFLLKFILQ
jgi:hypothetical protein